MAGNYDSIDLDWSWDGDFLVDSTGDLKDTSDDLLLSVRNEISSLVKSELGDWREDSNIGATLSDFVGEPNNRETAENIQARLESQLSQVVFLKDLSVRVTPVHIYRVLIMLSLEVLPTPENGLQSGEVLSTSFLYDYLENGVYVELEQMNHFAGRSS